MLLRLFSLIYYSINCDYWSNHCWLKHQSLFSRYNNLRVSPNKRQRSWTDERREE